MVNLERNQLIERYQAKGKLRGLGYWLDCVEDWDILIEMPEEIERHILDLRKQGFNRISVEHSVADEHVKYVEFIYMYHA